MKVITIKKKSILKTTMVIIFMLIICGVTTSFGMQHYYTVDFSTGLVTATNLNVRSGPGTQYKIVTTVPKNQYIRVFAGVGDWYIVQVEGDFVGAVSKKYVKVIYPKSFKIFYRTAGENIAANSSNSGAVNSWMNSSGHKANILNGNFNYTGIGVVSSSKYGKILVQIFIGK